MRYCILPCEDVKIVLSDLKKPDFLFQDNAPPGKEARQAFRDCLALLQGRLENEKPWKITEDFITELGELFFCGSRSISVKKRKARKTNPC